MKVATTVLTALLALGAAGAVRADEPGAASAAEDEGLVAVKIKGLDHVWARADANLSAYDKIMMDPVEVSFRWQKYFARSSRRKLKGAATLSSTLRTRRCCGSGRRFAICTSMPRMCRERA